MNSPSSPTEILSSLPGNEVRLRYAYFIKCTHLVKNDAGETSKSIAHTTRLRAAAISRWTQGQVHDPWVSAAHAKEAEIRMYHRLFTKEDPEEGDEGFDPGG